MDGGTPIRSALDGLRRALVPPRCLACRRLTVERHDQGLCPICRERLATPPPSPEPIPGIRRLLAVTAYDGVARPLVAAIKSGSLPAAAETAAELCAEREPGPEPSTHLVPVPASPLRSIRRGEDPAAALAEALGSRLAVGVRPVLRRLDRGRQRGRPRPLRIADPPRIEVAGAAPEQALLVDGVTTTGATLGACAEALLGAGSGSVDAVVLAATPPPSDRLDLPGPRRRIHQAPCKRPRRSG
jgi:predicted amidophosphoribosyltransferase